MINSGFILYSDFCKSGIICGTTLKGMNYAVHTAGNSKVIKEINENRNKIIQDLKFSSLITLKQIHSDIIHYINSINLKEFVNNSLIEGDGLFTSQKDILLGVLTADCIPIFYTDQKRSFAGVIHAGWRGVNKKIHLNMISSVNKELGIEREKLMIMIGPHINKCCYEVGKELIDSLNTVHYELRNGKYYLDLKEMVKSELIMEGIREDNILSYPACSKCGKEKAFYSYRSGTEIERMLSFIGLSK